MISRPQHLFCLALCLLYGAVLLSAQTAQAPKYKAVWEPVNVKADVALLDVYFVTDDMGWAAGGTTAMAGGVILNTRDGGANWTVQMGDPQSSDRAISGLRFIDATHGWAVQSGSSTSRLLRTDDGETWTQVGSVPEHYIDYTFTSLQHGIMAYVLESAKGDLEITNDGGNTWNQVATCETTAEIGGLTKRIGCEFLSLYFPSPATGYAVASSWDLPNGFVLFKTTDGGASWQHSVVKSEAGRAENVFFLDEKTGYVRIGAPNTGQLYRTADGGQSWTRMAASLGKSIRFADSEVGWAFDYRKLSYTASGGKMWTSRTFTFPASVNAFTLPTRHRAYAGGDHGMVYRYSVVPANYSGKGMIDAPMMPGYDLPINAGIEKLRPQIAALKSKIEHARKLAARDDTQPTRSFANGFLPQSATTSGGFVQSTPATSGGFEQSGPAGGFVQDTSPTVPVSPAMQSCCAADIQGMQTSFTGLNQSFPAFTTRYRALNLLLAGMQNFSDILSKLQAARTSFAALKSAQGLDQGAAALQQFSSQLDQMAQSATRSQYGVRQ